MMKFLDTKIGEVVVESDLPLQRQDELHCFSKQYCLAGKKWKKMSRECCGDVEEILSLGDEKGSDSLSTTIIGRLACSPELDCQIVDDTYADPPSKYYTKAARRHHDLSMYMEHINQTLRNQSNDDSNNNNNSKNRNNNTRSKSPYRTLLPNSPNSLASSHTSFHPSTALSSRLRLRRDSRKTPHAAPSIINSTHPLSPDSAVLLNQQRRQNPSVNHQRFHTEEQVEDAVTRPSDTRPSDIVQERRPKEVLSNQTETKSGYNNNNDMVNIDGNNRNSCRTITSNSCGKNTELVPLTNKSQNSTSSNNSNSTINSNNNDSSKISRNTIANNNTQRWSDPCSSSSMTFNADGYSSPSSSTEETSDELMPSGSFSSSSRSPPICPRRAASTSLDIPSPSSSPTHLSAAFRFSSALSSNPYLLPPLPPSLCRVSNGSSSLNPSSSLCLRSSALYSAAVTSNVGLQNSNPLPPHWRAADWNDQVFRSPLGNSENIRNGNNGYLIPSNPSTTVGETPISSRVSLNSSIPTSNIGSPLRLSLADDGGNQQQLYIHQEHQQQPRRCKK